jgi:hypothetical protein
MARRRKRRVGLPTAALIEFLSLVTLVAVVQPTWTTNFVNDLRVAASRWVTLSEMRLPVATSADSAAVDFAGIPSADLTASDQRAF